MPTCASSPQIKFFHFDPLKSNLLRPRSLETYVTLQSRKKFLAMSHDYCTPCMTSSDEDGTKARVLKNSLANMRLHHEEFFRRELLSSASL
ncbi:hypothetical protein JTE90_000530 [Oedothorax gibbosus]|uniref:Uncharacterized protein n=1 Tax=Oedothorax gibbosus TaxID=931172 RepID=A0AAV6VXJ7_9ARAC|nr:hypothetical protein JTE90_000530 [Oedothorax gibbosus]